MTEEQQARLQEAVKATKKMIDALREYRSLFGEDPQDFKELQDEFLELLFKTRNDKSKEPARALLIDTLKKMS